MTSTSANKPSGRKSLCLFTNILYVKKRIATRKVRSAKHNHKAIESGTTPWALKQKQKGDSKINDHIKNYLYN